MMVDTKYQVHNWGMFYFSDYSKSLIRTLGIDSHVLPETACSLDSTTQTIKIADDGSTTLRWWTWSQRIRTMPTLHFETTLLKTANLRDQ